jgi:hypothetical protein
MAMSALIISCMLFYSVSKYFPLKIPKIFRVKKALIVAVSFAFAFLSLYVLTYEYDPVTALVIWIVAVMTLLSCIVLTLTLYKISFYAWIALCFFLFFLDLL